MHVATVHGKSLGSKPDACNDLLGVFLRTKVNLLLGQGEFNFSSIICMSTQT